MRIVFYILKKIEITLDKIGNRKDPLQRSFVLAT